MPGRTLGSRRARLWAIPLATALVSLPAEQAAGGALERAMLGKSQVVDLTHALEERARSSPPIPPLAGQDHARNEVPGGEDGRSDPPRPSAPADLTTHLDLSVNAERGVPTVARIPARDFFVHAVRVDVTAKVAERADYRVTVEDLRAWERRNGRIPKGSMVLLHTGWSRRWDDPERYLNLDTEGVPRVPGLSPAARTFLVKERGVRGVGLDALSLEASPGNRHEEGRALPGAGSWQLVNLTNLDKLPARGAKLVIAPLRLQAGSAPVRVIAILP
jgi:kynurenine formamidase